MMHELINLLPALLAATPAGHAAPAIPGIETIGVGPQWAGWILWLPALSTVLCGLCAALRVKGKAPGWITVALLAGSFVATLALFWDHAGTTRVHLFDWFNLHWGRGEYAASFVANFALYIDGLTLLWMLFVTGLSTLIALYATEYMEADVGKGYARFFAGVSVFVFAMSSLVMGDNLIMLYLGWEGVGFASYWLIGYYYTKPSAVAAAKKAFIMNRIGDLGLALGIWLIYLHFGTVEYAELFAKLNVDVDGNAAAGGWPLKVLPFLIMLGAFGKSAQIPLFTWLPDAMEGPTPVSALIHAATMVTAGVYLLCRMFPVMMLNEYALPTVAWIGAGTALLAATIGMAQYDIKRVMAYSTVSQLGYMFAGIGVMTTFGAAYHVFTHAFFKAVLFLTCGAIMHGFAGQLDLRKVSGLRRMDGWGITAWTMLVGCLCLSGFPFTSGFFSKDSIIAQCFVDHRYGANWVGWILLVTAGLTAYYAFRVWFRVCAGPVAFEMGEEHHGAEDDHGHDAQGAHGAKPQAAAHGHDQPHAPRFTINFVLVVITIGALLAAVPHFMPNKYIGVDGGWVADMVYDSSAIDGVPLEHHTEAAGAGHGEQAAHGGILGYDPHAVMYYISGTIGIGGILIAFYFHLANRKAADALRARLLANPLTRWLVLAMANKWYVDEFYNAVVVMPLWIFSWILDLFDRWIVDGLLIDGTAKLPRQLGKAFQPLQNGILQSYAVSMAGGVGLVAVLVVLVTPHLRPWLLSLFGGAG
jgi:NADH-quinone oxidoreductase subunit L